MRGTWVLVLCLTNIAWALESSDESGEAVPAGTWGYVPGLNGTF